MCRSACFSLAPVPGFNKQLNCFLFDYQVIFFPQILQTTSLARHLSSGEQFLTTFCSHVILVFYFDAVSNVMVWSLICLRFYFLFAFVYRIVIFFGTVQLFGWLHLFFFSTLSLIIYPSFDIGYY